MRISYLELKNYRRFRDLRLQLPDGVVGILGLNGSGKTTIIEAVAWCLFGNVEEVVRTNKESIRRLGAGKADSVSVVLEFELEGSEYRLEREMGGRSLSMKAQLRSGGEMVAEGDRAVKTKVAELIGMDHKSFFTSVFARQKELNELQNFTPAERKRVVLRMLRIDNVDNVIQSVREDRRHASERVRGGENVILDQDGVDREKGIASRLEDLKRKAKEVETRVRDSKDKEASLVRKLEDTRKRRDALKKDVDEHNSLSSELKAKRSSIAEQRATEQRLTKKIEETKELLAELPRLRASDEEWQRVVKAKEDMDGVKTLHDKAERIRGELRTLNADISEARTEADELHGTVEEEKLIQVALDKAEDDKRSSEREKEETARAITEMAARQSERENAVAKERKKLEEIEAAGREGRCPTCERELGESYAVIIEKLRESVERAQREVSEDEEKASRMRAEQEKVSKRLEALDRKAKHQNEKLTAVRQKIASIKTRTKELSRLEKRREEKSRELGEVGEAKYSAKEHDELKSSATKLQDSHDRLVKLLERQRQMSAIVEERESLMRTITDNAAAEKRLLDKVEALGPKKREYDESIAEFDRAYDTLALARDEMSALRAEQDMAKVESESAKRELEVIREQKKTIAAEREKMDDLGALEETLVGFKDHLIGKVAPALAETTSEIMGLMTDGKYERIELDEDYQISVDEDGVLYPFDRCSGGEADLANLSLRLAISRIIAERSATSQMNFLILDEIFGSLDPHRKRSVMAALSGLSSQFRQVMLISHVEDVRDLMTTVVRVEELPDGTSTAKIVS
ncbi:TPA: SMC family ATPase [Thermoplasmata archaeon]|nr:SMC family ATPase [Thermoplasmata archaeon]